MAAVSGSRPHEVLGVPPDATAEQVRKAYKRIARRTHPDRNPRPGAAERFMAATAARDEMLRRIEAGLPPEPEPARPVDETIRPPPDQVRTAAPPIHLDDEDLRLALRDLWRPALYVGAALVWFLVLWMFSSTMAQVAQVLGPGGLPPAKEAPAKGVPAKGAKGAPGAERTPGRSGR